MRQKRHYLSLTFHGGNAYHKSGSRLKLTERIVNIGETADCDVRFDSDGYLPEYYASIIRDDEKGWRIVRRSQYVDVSIVGKGSIGYAALLNDGDLLQFGDHQMTVSVHTRYDDRYGETKRKMSVLMWLAPVLASVIGIIVAVVLISRPSDGISEKDVLPLESSICLVKVDSVQQVMIAGGVETLVRPTMLTDNKPTGSAFLTVDGRLVTARHCVEYWLAYPLDLTTKVATLADDDIVRWAIETETFNQIHADADSAMLLRTWFSVYDAHGNRKYVFSSTDSRCHVNNANDGVFLLADFSGDYYWRSIRPYFKDKRMTMGDLLWIDLPSEKGLVQLATAADIEAIRPGTKLMVCGFPQTGTGDHRIIPASGTIKRMPDISIENLFFESNINHGYSGAPVFMKAGKRVVAIGVVSCVDSVSSGLFKWAVPITEMQ